MKKLSIIFILFFVQICFGQKKILFQEKEQTIFIDSSKNSDFFKRRKIYEFSRKFEDSLIIDTLKSFKKVNNVRDFDLKNLPKKWLELFVYKGKYYTYYPCEFCGDVDNFEIENSVYFIYRCELLDIYKINSFSKEKNIYTLKSSNKYINSTLKIYIINEKKGVAVFERNVSGEISYKLMLDVTKINQYPMIVNDCKSKQSEFRDFEEPNFNKLLNQK